MKSTKSKSPNSTKSLQPVSTKQKMAGKSRLSANDVTLIKKMLKENKGAGALSDATKKRIAALKMTLE